MKCYLLRPSTKKRARYLINAAHDWCVPGVDCPECGPWARTGLIYPTISPETVGPTVSLPRASNVPLASYHELISVLRPFLRASYDLAPGTEFGPLFGTASGVFADISWINPWTPLFTSDALLKLKHNGIDVPAVEAKLRYRKAPCTHLLEPELLPTVDLHDSTYIHPLIEPCRLCGRQRNERRHRPVIDGSTFATGVPLQRIRQHPTQIVANENFAAVAEQLKLDGFALVPLDVVS